MWSSLTKPLLKKKKKKTIVWVISIFKPFVAKYLISEYLYDGVRIDLRNYNSAFKNYKEKDDRQTVKKTEDNEKKRKKEKNA